MAFENNIKYKNIFLYLNENYLVILKMIMIMKFKLYILLKIN